MNTEKIWQINSDNLKETDQLAKKLASNVVGGEVIEFKSDLGGGKTTFVKSFVDALGSSDHVSSPTFTVSKEYKTKKFNIYHFDFYRVPDPGLISDSLKEVAVDNSSICLIEWGNSVDHVLPKNRLIIKIDKHPTIEEKRLFTFEFSDKTKYLLKGLI